MTPIVELITEWDEFTSQKSAPVTVEAFCAYYLNKQTATKPIKTTPDLDHEVAKVIGRLGSIHKTYSKIAFRQLPGVELEWYFLLHSVKNSLEIRKTEVISFNLLLEPTTCIDILNRMIKAGLLAERTDPEDKRARLIKITPKGQALLNDLQILINQTSTSLYGQLAAEDKIHLIKLLNNIATTHAATLLDLGKKKRSA